MSLRLKMNDVPYDVRPMICELLRHEGYESVHMGYQSNYLADDFVYVVIARLTEPVDEYCYAVYTYYHDVKRLKQPSNDLTYGEALIEMGERISE